MSRSLPLLAFGLLLLTGCMVNPKGAFTAERVPPVPDYQQDRFWAALPWKDDPADLTPNGLTDQQEAAGVDVFFIHPTTYTGKRGQDNWNGPVRDADLNARTLESTIQYQASLFNGVGRVFAPFYRQAHLQAYFTKDTLSARRAFDLAYSDVRAAFRHYLRHHNQGRPILIASHSQGTTHARRLLQEFFDGKPLYNQLVAAYIVGLPVYETDFTSIPPCQTEEQTGCFCTWRTFRRGTEAPEPDPTVVVTNPLRWTTEQTYAPDSLNLGAVLRPFDTLRPGATDAQVQGPILVSRRPSFPGSWLLLTRNYHVGDLNLFYQNIRENARLRARAFAAP
ncbi:MAG: DUF3089 domain-containing protein [Lewinella sp.]|nr:DUF3089 domain-containing protein [Lewinella sp.]